MRLGRAAGQTDTGRRRRQNEDAFVCEPPLFAVADGMGGAQAGELASRLAAAAIEEGAVRVNGLTVRPRDPVVGGEVAVVEARLVEETGVMAEKLPIDIVHEDASVIVINKPPGLVVHPGAGNRATSARVRSRRSSTSGTHCLTQSPTTAGLAGAVSMDVGVAHGRSRHMEGTGADATEMGARQARMDRPLDTVSFTAGDFCILRSSVFQ